MNISTLPSPTKVAGSHASIYETYYNLVDPNHHGQVGAMDAAKFLKKSHLSDVVLSKIWDIADPSSRGFLDKPGIYVALKLCALAQQGHNLNISNIFMDIPPPKMGEMLNTARILPCPQSTVTHGIDTYWSITASELAKYQKLFQSLEPVSGYVPGNKVKGVLMDSKLPLETLGKIWDLADIDKDGKLNEHEFIVAMHLVYKALEKNTVPSVLPAELMDYSNTRIDKGSNLQASVVPMSDSASTNISSSVFSTELKWIVSYEELVAADKLFKQADTDMDGFVSGSEVKDIFFQSGISQSILAHIWSLCDISQSGKLNNEQFALAMWFIKQKLKGNELPTKLSSEMVPPSLKQKSLECIIENNNTCGYSNPELDMINKDITDIILEKHAIEQDVSQKEADIRVKNGEIKSLQSELDTLAATLRQLDNQKGEAQKRLNDLKVQVDKLRQQATDQEFTLHIQEDELNNKRQEIESLKITEQNLEKQQLDYKNQLNNLTIQLQNIQLQTSQRKANMTQLEEQQHQLIDGITQYDAAFASGDVTFVPDTYLSFIAKLDDATYGFYKLNSDINSNGSNENEDNIFTNSEKIRRQSNFASFNKNENYERNRDSFETVFQSESENESFCTNRFNTRHEKSCDPFNDDTIEKSNKYDSTQIEDPFGEDPFAALHAPTRSESPSPALPPKKSKQPPPRPAPPRLSTSALRTPTSSAITTIDTSDPFAEISSKNTVSNTYDFADFRNFDLKMHP